MREEGNTRTAPRDGFRDIEYVKLQEGVEAKSSEIFKGYERLFYSKLEVRKRGIAWVQVVGAWYCTQTDGV